MSIVLCAHTKCSRILQDILALLELLDLRTFYQIAGNADDIAVGRIEGQITDTFTERALDNIEQELVVLMYRRVDRENITGT